MIKKCELYFDGTYERVYMVTEREQDTRTQELESAFLLDYGKKFVEFVSEADKCSQEIEPGEYKIEIAKVLLVSLFTSEEEPECSNIVIVRDTDNRAWVLPEGLSKGKDGGPLKSRWDVHAGMKAKLIVEDT
jgi:hypothetical protein